MKRQKGCRVSCGVGEATGGLENELWRRWSDERIRAWVRKSRYWGEMLLSPIHSCDVTKPRYFLSGEPCSSPFHSNRFYVYTVCSRRGGQCFSVLRTRHTDVVRDSSGRSYVTEQGHNVPLLRIRGLENELWRRWSDGRVEGWGSAHSSTLPSLYLSHSYSITFRRFTYVTAHSTTLTSLHLRHRHFTYVTWRAAHELELLH